MSNLRAFTMPKWGIEMTEGTVAEWMVREGQAHRRGEVITLIETDKITNEIEAEYDATVMRLIAEPGSTLPVGSLLGVFATGPATTAEVDAFVAAFRPPDVSTASSSGGGGPPPAGVKPASTAEHRPAVTIPVGTAISPAARELVVAHGIDVTGIDGSGPGRRITFQDVDQALRPPAPPPTGVAVSIVSTTAPVEKFYASPLAKRLAVLHDVDLGAVTGTGPRGRITKADVLAAAAPPPATIEPEVPVPVRPSAGGHEVVRMSSMRKAIARQLTRAKQTIPHFYLRSSVRVDGLLAMRQAAKRATGEAPSLNDYLVRAVALALREHRDVNIQVHDDEIWHFPTADIAVAVSTPRGLITPIVRAAETKSVARLSAEIKALAERARAGRLTAEEFQGGSFSVSNLGMYGIEQFDGIINPPQGAILAIGAATRRPVEVDHALLFATIIQLSLSCDHRAIDGAAGAEFLRTLRTLIEDSDRLTA
jgi:pyruvate dehydrogenase E2 component (dihydrolipoamide acetyltransferase)